MHSSLVRSLRLNLTNLQSTHNEKNTPSSSSRQSTTLPHQHTTQNSEQQIGSKPLPAIRSSMVALESSDEKPLSGVDTARLISARFKSIALGIHVKLKEAMEKYKSEQYRNIFLVNYCLEVLEELGRMFIVFEDVAQCLKIVFSQAIFSDKVTADSDASGGESIIHQIPFYDYYLKKQKLVFLAESQEKSMKELHRIQQKEAAFIDLKKAFSEEKAYSTILKNENQKLKTQVEEITHAVEREKRNSEKTLREVKYKYDIAKTMIKKLKRDVKQLREYKHHQLAVNRDSFILKKTSQDSVIEMFSRETEASVLKTLQNQLEIVENYRLDKYGNEFSRVLSGGKSELKSGYVNDINLLVNEMNMLQIKHEGSSVQKQRASIPINRSTLANNYVAPLRDLDGIKFRSYIELFISRDNLKSFQLLERMTVTPQTEPTTFVIPSDTTHIRFLHSKYNYTKPHPSFEQPREVIEDRSSKEVESQGSEETMEKLPQFVQTPEIWKYYLNRYRFKFPSVPRMLSLSQLRSVIYLTYEEQSRVLSVLTDEKKLDSVPPLFDFLENIINRLYVIPETVMKVLFEVLLSLEKHKLRHADVLEFSLSSVPRDPAQGHCLSMVLALIKALWLTVCDNYTQSLSRSDTEKLLRLLYPSLTEEEMNRVFNLVLGSEFSESRGKREYSIGNVNKAFIIGFRDATEYWCYRAEQTLQDLYLREMISLEEFVRFMHEDLPHLPLDALNVRFHIACRNQMSQTHLHYKTIAYIYAEFRWVDCSSRISKQLQIELTPVL